MFRVPRIYKAFTTLFQGSYRRTGVPGLCGGFWQCWDAGLILGYFSAVLMQMGMGGTDIGSELLRRKKRSGPGLAGSLSGFWNMDALVGGYLY